MVESPFARIVRRRLLVLASVVLGAWLLGGVLAHAEPMALTVDLDGELREVTSESETVTELLAEQGIEFSTLDSIFPPPSALLTPGAFVVVRRAKIVKELPIRDIAPATQLRLSEALPPGATTVQRAGKVGQVREVVVTYPADDPEGLDPETHLVVLAPPEDRLVAIGLASEDGPPRMISRGPMALRATSYCPYGDASGGGPSTAVGLPAAYGIIAVDPRFIPLGAHVYVERYGHALAADTGGAIKGRIIDVCYESPALTSAFGRRNVTARILD